MKLKKSTSNIPYWLNESPEEDIESTIFSLNYKKSVYRDNFPFEQLIDFFSEAGPAWWRLELCVPVMLLAFKSMA